MALGGRNFIPVTSSRAVAVLSSVLNVYLKVGFFGGWGELISIKILFIIIVPLSVSLNYINIFLCIYYLYIL